MKHQGDAAYHLYDGTVNPVSKQLFSRTEARAVATVNNAKCEGGKTIQRSSNKHTQVIGYVHHLSVFIRRPLDGFTTLVFSIVHLYDGVLFVLLHINHTSTNDSRSKEMQKFMSHCNTLTGSGSTRVSK